MTQRELDARVASIQYTETTDLNLPAIEVAGDAFEAGVEWADEHPHWISVEDELPEACVAVLTTTQNGTQRVGCYEDGWWLANSPNLVRMGSITHWMPLPQPPAVISSLEIAGKKWKGGEQ